jgi:hypothetical protein
MQNSMPIFLDSYHEYHPIIASIFIRKDHVTFHELSSQLIPYEILLKNYIHSPASIVNVAQSTTTNN